MRKIKALTLLALAAAASTVSCRSTSTTYRFTPSPLEVLVAQGDTEPILARVLVAIPGAEREGGRSSGMPELLVRVRVESRSDGEIRFDPARSTLVGPDLARFGDPKTEFEGDVIIPARRSKDILLRYPFPRDGSLHAPLLTGVNLTFELDLDGLAAGDEAVEVSATLEREAYYPGNGNVRNSVMWGTGFRGGWGPGLGRGIGWGPAWGVGFANNFYGCW